MLHLEAPEIRRCLLEGKFGLEKEGLRVRGDGTMAHTAHPFTDSSHITRDFSENQTEINTSAEPSAEGAVLALEAYSRQMQKVLAGLPEREYIWPFSNPPFLAGEEDIRIAQFGGALASKTEYRKYLSGRYGRYKMTFSGIHVNYSFSDELLRREYCLRGTGRSRSFRDGFYLELAEKAAAYGWLLVLLTAASPVLDVSFYEQDRKDGAGGGLAVTGRGEAFAAENSAEEYAKKSTAEESVKEFAEKSAGKSAEKSAGRAARDVFSGMASVRCSELGYWNAFAPVFDYTNIQRYADGVRSYVDQGLLYSASELYYPVRLKPKGENSLEALKEGGIDHIELRMFDLNPLVPAGLEVRDVQFAQLFLVWLASLPRRVMSPLDQVLAVQNFKNAAHYDLRTVRIVMPELAGEAAETAEGAALSVLLQMQDFYRQPLLRDLPDWVDPVLEFQIDKIRRPSRRYAVQVRERYSSSFLEKGMAQAVLLQESACGET